jgi:hypothetical protein
MELSKEELRTRAEFAFTISKDDYLDMGRIAAVESFIDVHRGIKDTGLDMVEGSDYIKERIIYLIETNIPIEPRSPLLLKAFQMMDTLVSQSAPLIHQFGKEMIKEVLGRSIDNIMATQMPEIGKDKAKQISTIIKKMLAQRISKL